MMQYFIGDQGAPMVCIELVNISSVNRGTRAVFIGDTMAEVRKLAVRYFNQNVDPHETDPLTDDELDQYLKTRDMELRVYTTRFIWERF